MTIYLDDESKHVYGLLATFMKVTDNSINSASSGNNNKQPKEETIVLNGCSIDPYIFGNFETDDGGDSITARFRAFKFPESNYVMFVGTVNVCLDKCHGVQCGNDIVAFGKRRKRFASPIEPNNKDNKMYEIEMITYIKIGDPTKNERQQKRRSNGKINKYFNNIILTIIIISFLIITIII